MVIRQRFSTGVIAAGGTLKSLIPPSLVMIIYCVVAKTFILDMFVAAIVPALITIAFNLLAIAVVVRRRPQIAPVSARLPWNERLDATWRAAPSLALLLGVFAGIYSGIFTVNEAASAAAMLALLFAVARRRLTWDGAGSRHVRGRLGYRHALSDPDGRSDLHVFHQSRACAGRIGSVDRRPPFPAARRDLHADGRLHSARHVLRGDVVDPHHSAVWSCRSSSISDTTRCGGA